MNEQLASKIKNSLGVWVTLNSVLGKEDFLVLQALSKWFYEIGISRSQQRLILRKVAFFKHRIPFWRPNNGPILVWRKNQENVQIPQFSGVDKDLKKNLDWVSTALDDKKMHQGRNSS